MLEGRGIEFVELVCPAPGAFRYCSKNKPDSAATTAAAAAAAAANMDLTMRRFAPLLFVTPQVVDVSAPLRLFFVGS